MSVTLLREVLPPAPHEPELRLDGWRLELDIRAIKNTRAWRIANPDQRSLFSLMLIEAWDAVPIGALPADPDELAGALGFTSSYIRANLDWILSCWNKHADGNLYCQCLEEQITNCEKRKEKARNRQAKRRANVGKDCQFEMDLEHIHPNGNAEKPVTARAGADLPFPTIPVTRDSRADQDQDQDQKGKSSAFALPSFSGEKESSAISASGRKSDGVSPASDERSPTRRRQYTPMAKICARWRQIRERHPDMLADLEDPENWSRRRRDRVRALWRDQLPDLVSWAYIFELTCANSELRRRVESSAFTVGFDWLLKADNLIAIHEGSYRWGN